MQNQISITFEPRRSRPLWTSASTPPPKMQACGVPSAKELYAELSARLPGRSKAAAAKE
ncbi:MAG: hypothetical protein LBU92_00835 [Prevotellaceae bacterium]|nr:hypothetical protein [Prevotellaceae bacterium]